MLTTKCERKKDNMFKVTNEMTANKISAEVKRQVVAFLMEAAVEKFGDARMMRTGTPGSKSKTNEIGFVFDSAEDVDGTVHDIVVALNPTVKSFTHSKTEKRTTVPFDFAAAVQAYEDNETAKAEKKKAKTESE